jgi:hypothetical protein
VDTDCESHFTCIKEVDSSLTAAQIAALNGVCTYDINADCKAAGATTGTKCAFKDFFDNEYIKGKCDANKECVPNHCTCDDGCFQADYKCVFADFKGTCEPI